jgi:hypothetical protein
MDPEQLSNAPDFTHTATSLTGTASPAMLPISASVSSQGLRLSSTTLHPSSTKRMAIPWPNPREAPLMTHTLPAKRGSFDMCPTRPGPDSGVAEALADMTGECCKSGEIRPLFEKSHKPRARAREDRSAIVADACLHMRLSGFEQEASFDQANVSSLYVQGGASQTTPRPQLLSTCLARPQPAAASPGSMNDVRTVAPGWRRRK